MRKNRSSFAEPISRGKPMVPAVPTFFAVRFPASIKEHVNPSLTFASPNNPTQSFAMAKIASYVAQIWSRRAVSRHVATRAPTVFVRASVLQAQHNAWAISFVHVVPKGYGKRKFLVRRARPGVSRACVRIPIVARVCPKHAVLWGTKAVARAFS